jgi:acetyltransferase-like isoleucine patch superfamily enzyme
MNRIAALLFGEFRISWWKSLLQFSRRRRVLVGRRFRVLGAPEITRGGRLTLGTLPYGFALGSERGLLRVRGRMFVDGIVAIGVGSRVDVGPSAQLRVGDGTYFSPNVRIVLTSGLSVGSGCAVSWDVQILDDDHHLIDSGRGFGPSSKPIEIGDRVWIGSRATILKGVRIADGCVIASGAVVTRSVEEPNSLVAGSPARIVRRDVNWK